MKNTDTTLHRTSPPENADGSASKKPYDPPRVVSFNPLEVITGACSPSPPAKASAANCSLSAS